MIPQSPDEPTTSEGDHMTSHDPETVQPTLPLTEALRVSIAGEDMDEHISQLAREELSLREQEGDSLNLMVPDDMAVDLRVKLAVSMIHLGMTVPEVRDELSITCRNINNVPCSMVDVYFVDFRSFFTLSSSTLTTMETSSWTSLMLTWRTVHQH